MMELKCIASLASTVEGASNGGPPSTALLFSLNGVYPYEDTKGNVKCRNCGGLGGSSGSPKIIAVCCM